MERNRLVSPGHFNGGLGFNGGRSCADRTGAKDVSRPKDTSCLLAHVASTLRRRIWSCLETGDWTAYDERSIGNWFFQFGKNSTVRVPHPDGRTSPGTIA